MTSISTETIAAILSEPPVLAPDQLEHAAAIERLVEGETNWDKRLIACSDWINPILVKEARQALKSKQFVITFTLVLICGWGWSLLGVAALQEGVYYAPSGPYMLVGYFWVLAFPLLLIVPFAAFRSLAAVPGQSINSIQNPKSIATCRLPASGSPLPSAPLICQDRPSQRNRAG